MGKTKNIGIYPNFDLLLPRHHPELLFGISTFLDQKETEGSIFVFLSLLKSFLWGHIKANILKIASLEFSQLLFSGYNKASLFKDVVHAGSFGKQNMGENLCAYMPFDSWLSKYLTYL